MCLTAGLTMVLERLEVGLAIRGRRWSFDVNRNWLFLAAFDDSMLVVGLQRVLTFRRLLESELVNFHRFSRKQDENPKISGQRSRQEENPSMNTLKGLKETSWKLQNFGLSPFVVAKAIKEKSNGTLCATWTFHMLAFDVTTLHSKTPLGINVGCSSVIVN
ncbi:hypothetical protein E6C27_scaffold207G002260 [Cucumis melo var. makuwa]|uniref:Uncharacterized protein n=1 Tax=Cucumis melo var. makuwa TaxID=1194695 RepID=A0A5A7UFX3_CUCMM|nr:hypothetical protein E6C27_scaffold207G002260 [Cucumis melo var. makuwa]